MKKNLALILALVMILGSLFSVVPMAEGEDESGASESTGRYVPEIAYANVNYTDSIYMMFAVPAPAALDEDESVKLLVWDSRMDSVAYSYYDSVKDTIEAEENLVTIGEQSYLVFNFKGIDAAEMTKTICARPVVVKGETATSYGKLVEYSILEYVESAKGNIDGIEGIENEETIGLLDHMLTFGALAQQFTGDEDSLVPTDDLHKIYATTIVNGINKGRVFAGFFKYEEGDKITFEAPFFDGTTINKTTDVEGNDVVDLDDFADGIQFAAIDGDIEFVVYYKNAIARSFNADIFGAGMEANNYDDVAGGNDKVSKKSDGYTITFKGYGSANLSGVASKMDSYKRMNYWHSIKTVASPIEGDDGVVFQLTATNKPALQFNNVTSAEFKGVGFGDTVYPAFTFEMYLGAVGGKMPTTGSYYFRQRLKGADVKGPDGNAVDTATWVDFSIFTIKNGKVLLLDETDKDYSDNPVVGQIPETGMRKFAITVDALTGMAYGYAEDENGVMQPTTQAPLMLNSTFTSRQEKYLSDPEGYAGLACYENIYTFFTASPKALEPTWVFGNGSETQKTLEEASIEIDGVMTPLVSGLDDAGNKIFNMEAVKAYAEQNYSFLLDDFNLVMGYAYE